MTISRIEEAQIEPIRIVQGELVQSDSEDSLWDYESDYWITLSDDEDEISPEARAFLDPELVIPEFDPAEIEEWLQQNYQD